MKKNLILLSLTVATLLAQEPTKENVAQLYVATFDRASESAGLNYWLYDSGLNLEGIARSFFDQKETKLRYPSYLSTEDFIKAVYRNLFDREPDEAGLKYWKDQIDNGIIPRDEFILATINGALGKDKQIMSNKTDVSLYFADSSLSDVRMAEFCVADVDDTKESVKESKSMIDDFLDGRVLTEYGEDKREKYFLYDINASDSKYVYKLDGCVFPSDRNTSFTYRIYSDNSASITYTDDEESVTYPCVVKQKLKRVEPTDGNIDAQFIKDSTALDGETQTYYHLASMSSGRMLSIEDNGTRAYVISSSGYRKYTDIVDAFKNIPLTHRGIKPLLDNKNIIEYGYMRRGDRNYIQNANGDLYVYKLGRCIFPRDKNTTYRFNIYKDYTASITFVENDVKVDSECAVKNRYRKVYSKDDDNLSAKLVSSPLYYDDKGEQYYKSIYVYKGTLKKVSNGGKLAKIEKSSTDSYYYGPVYDLFKIDPPSHKGRVEIKSDDNSTIEDTGYMRVYEQNSLYDLRGENYAYQVSGCDFPSGKYSIYRFFVYEDGNVSVVNVDDDTMSKCTVKHKYQFVNANDGDEYAKLYKDGFYYSQDKNLYYKSSTKVEKGVITSIFNNGQSAYIKDNNDTYYWKPIYETLKPIF